jgi:hypothetical protein
MYIITIKGLEDEGAYAVKDEFGEKVVFLFEEQDDAVRYALLMEEDGCTEMDVIKVNDTVAIAACEKAGIRYTIITEDDIVIPPRSDND